RRTKRRIRLCKEGSIEIVSMSNSRPVSVAEEEESRSASAISAHDDDDDIVFEDVDASDHDHEQSAKHNPWVLRCHQEQLRKIAGPDNIEDLTMRTRG